MNTHSTTPAWRRLEPQLDAVLARFDIPASFRIQAWSPNYFDAMCALSSGEGWTTPEQRPKETLVAWENSWPTLVAVDTGGKLVGFLRAITDTQITTYLCEVLVAREFRRLGLGRLLIDVCQGLVPTTRLDLLSTDESDDFYRVIDCVDFQGFRRRSKVTGR
ncbi:GNAT family N-acetyltransferase [Candidatus Poribacteria bacterium]|nr:GNAT family N-acetyltransferase [Candidatus Poribacteria bacterium]